MPSAQARYWIGTVFADWTPPAELSARLVYLRGQQEICPTTERRHWQLVAGFARAVRLPAVKENIAEGHWEPSRSALADAYVWKDESAVLGTRFQLGEKPIRRNCGADWEKIRTAAKGGKLDEIPADIYIR